MSYLFITNKFSRISLHFLIYIHTEWSLKKINTEFLKKFITQFHRVNCEISPG